MRRDPVYSVGVYDQQLGRGLRSHGSFVDADHRLVGDAGRGRRHERQTNRERGRCSPAAPIRAWRSSPAASTPRPLTAPRRTSRPAKRSPTSTRPPRPRPTCTIRRRPRSRRPARCTQSRGGYGFGILNAGSHAGDLVVVGGECAAGSLASCGDWQLRRRTTCAAQTRRPTTTSCTVRAPERGRWERRQRLRRRPTRRPGSVLP